jgi:hypothetical protein
MVDADEGAGFACPACAADNVRGQSFCSACGASLAAPSRSRRTRGDAAQQQQGRREFGRIKSVVLAVRSVFWVGVLLAGLSVLVWTKVQAVWPGSDTTKALVWALLLAELALMLAGAWLVVRAPLIWTVVAASCWTLTTVATLWLTDFAVPPTMLLRLLVVVCFWFAVAQAARVQRLMAADPSLQIVRRRIDPARRVVGGVADDAKERRRQDGRAQRARRLRLVAAVAVGIVAAWFIIGFVQRPPAGDEAIARFAERWPNGDAAAIGADFADGGHGRRGVQLGEQLARRGFHVGSMPALGEPKIERADEQVAVSWPFRAGQVRAVFLLDERRWVLADVELPPIEAGDPAPAVAAFRTAWDTPGLAALLAMLRPESRERLGGSMERLLKKRDWHERRLALGTEVVGRATAGRCRVALAVGDGEVVVQFEYWAPSWRVVSLSLPNE